MLFVTAPLLLHGASTDAQTKSPGSKAPGKPKAPAAAKGPTLDETMTGLVKAIDEKGDYVEECRSSSNIRQDEDATGSVDLVMKTESTVSASRAGDCVLVVKRRVALLGVGAPPHDYDHSISLRDFAPGSASLIAAPSDEERVCTPAVVYRVVAKAAKDLDDGTEEYAATKKGADVQVIKVADKAVAELVVADVNRAIALCGAK